MNISMFHALMICVLAIIAFVCFVFYSALRNVSHTKIKKLSKDENQRAERALVFLESVKRHLSVLLLVFVVFIFLDSWYVLVAINTYTTDDFLGRLLAVLFVLFFDIVIFVMCAKFIGSKISVAIVLWFQAIIGYMSKIFWPFARLLNFHRILSVVMKIFPPAYFSSELDLSDILERAEKNKLIDRDENAMVKSILELEDTFVKEVMVPRTEMVWIEKTKTLQQAMALSLRSGYSRIPVTNKGIDDIVGVIYVKDVARRLFEVNAEEEVSNEHIEKRMREAYFVPDSKRAYILLREMQAARVHMAIVVDEYGGTAGIVTIEDIIEEIVGEIVDEYDTTIDEITDLGEGKFRVSARLHLENAEELLSVDLDAEDEDVDTLVGYMAKVLGRVPIKDSVITVSGWKLTAEIGKDRRNRVASILIERTEVMNPISDVEEDFDS